MINLMYFFPYSLYNFIKKRKKQSDTEAYFSTILVCVTYLSIPIIVFLPENIFLLALVGKDYYIWVQTIFLILLLYLLVPKIKLENIKYSEKIIKYSSWITFILMLSPFIFVLIILILMLI